MTEVRFTKMHGLGNDYLIINALADAIEDAPQLARAMCDRHCGVGADGIILILPAEGGVDAHARMRIFNADGSEAQMCGNGIRCVCKYIIESAISGADPLRIQTGAGVLTLEYARDRGGRVNRVTVDMGPPALDLTAVGVDEVKVRGTGDGQYTFEIDGQTLTVTFVSMGNPHAIVFADSIGDVDLGRLGPLIERHPAFPDRINAHFAHVISRAEVNMRTWERGSGATLACGTGAAAVCVAGVVNHLTDRRITAHLPGGDLQLRWDETTDHVFMTGPADEVFSGAWPQALRRP